MPHDAPKSKHAKKEPPQLPASATRFVGSPEASGAEASTAVSSAATGDLVIPKIVTQPEPPPSRLPDVLLSAAAVGYYVSLLLHVVAYSTGALVFVWLGNHLLEREEVVTPLRASLDEYDRVDERPQFEAVAEININPAKTESSIERMSNNLRVAKNGILEAMPSELLPSVAGEDRDGDTASEAAEFLFKLPESGLAVTKGSFTVWSDPEVPRVSEDYKLIVEIRLPDGIKAYRINDLSGRVIGSDGYRQNIPYDSNGKGSVSYTDENLKEVRVTSSSEIIKVRDNKVQLVINVLGASRLVKDVIQVRSRRLNERQELELVFGGK